MFQFLLKQLLPYLYLQKILTILSEGKNFTSSIETSISYIDKLLEVLKPVFCNSDDKNKKSRPTSDKQKVCNHTISPIELQGCLETENSEDNTANLRKHQINYTTKNTYITSSSLILL